MNAYDILLLLVIMGPTSFAVLLVSGLAQGFLNAPKILRK